MAKGRPQAPLFIIPENEIMDRNEILREETNITVLARAMPDTWQSVKWCARHRLISNSFMCNRCDVQCSLISRSDISDSKTWYCRGCKNKKSIREGSWFAKSHLSLYQIVIIVYCWAHDFPQKDIAREANWINSDTTLVDWCNFCRELCEQWLEENPMEIGGIDEANGEPLIVEVDESKYFYRKYHRGQWRQGQWVFGGVERRSGKCFLVVVPDRRESSLRAATERWVLPGTHIISDGWASYQNINVWANGVYTHSAVIHERNFVDPNDSETHTQNIENLWMRAKRKIRRQFGTSETLFPSYLHEFMWRNSIPEKPKTFNHFLLVISAMYSVN